MIALIHGEAKIGVSSLLHDLAKHLKLESVTVSPHGGFNRSVDAVGVVCDTWEKLRSGVTNLSNSPDPNTLLVLDDLEAIYQLCRAHVLEANGFRAEADGERGLGWSLVTDEWRKFIKVVLRGTPQGGPVVFTAHTRLFEVVTTARHYHRFEPDVTPRALSEVTALADIILCAKYATAGSDSDNPRELHTQGSEAVVAGGSSKQRVVPMETKALAAALKEHL